MVNEEHFDRINGDVNGNPRYVCHYTHLMTNKDEFTSLQERYKLAVKRANKLGGRKFNNKQYGGGVVFSSYNLKDTCNEINTFLQNI